MLELTGKCCVGIEAIEFMESLADVIDEDTKTDEFCEEFEDALNRFRYEVAKGIGRKKKIIKAKSRGTFMKVLSELRNQVPVNLENFPRGNCEMENYVGLWILQYRLHGGNERIYVGGFEL